MKILFDNYNYDKNCKSLWGFSVYLKKYNLLFDTGSNGRVLLANMRELNIDIKKIKYIFITHSHWDHIGGIDSILELNRDIRLFVPSSLSKHLIKDLKTLAKEVIVCSKESKRLFGNIYTTGLLGDEIPEQSLIIDDDYPNVIVGCGHFGVDNILEVAKKTLAKEIKFVIGGFHLMYSEKQNIEKTISRLKNLGVKRVLPTHCTGDEAIEMFRYSFKENCIDGGVGSVL